MLNKTFFCFDFGTKNIGVAIGQNIICIANPLTTIQSKKKNHINWIKIQHLLKIWQPNHIIIGYPMNMDGTDQRLTDCVKIFAKTFNEKFKIPVEFYDERLSTVEAKSKLFKKGGYRALKKKYINSLSAVVILQSWFEDVYKKNK
ncbi:Holliday junction resolvase RuvX [Candidatus Tachikawaea gelatinosa]|uniref:Putative pre-16S rRNA nuclease n=1 Tax=Candidatus Tachikawaea gelatinosa TaxID=1410383 RepID=A0A090AK78_9ENTR|nr:Holliday junction resolvase RuvX [Candidatus Tachikawaea gelatinosa]BAP58838.1 putative Holliday junction resolvase [Candidatus Tachikawaea gelatinosa]